MNELAFATDIRPGAPDETLRLAVLGSRQRWQQFGLLAADFVFETDALGNFSFLAPEHLLGWPAASLLGRPAAALLAEPAGTDPFQFTTAAERRHTWLRHASGEPVCVAITSKAMLDDAGGLHGIRGIGIDVTQQERASLVAAATIRRSAVLDHILGRLRQEMLAPRMMRAALDAVMRALGCPGTAILDLKQDSPHTLHDVGLPAPDLGPVAAELASPSDETRTLTLPGGEQLLATFCSTRFGERAVLLAWRDAGARPWDADDLALANSVAGIVRIVLEHESIQRELARQARTDPLTGLLNRRAFLEESARRLDRLERDGLHGTILFIDLDHLKQLNDRRGHEHGDAALLLVSGLLQRTFRPSDLIARIGGDEFAVWLDNADSFTAAERAEGLRIAMPAEVAHLSEGESGGVTLSTGIATRSPGSDETLDQMIFRADQAMYEVKRGGRGYWRVSPEPPLQ